MSVDKADNLTKLRWSLPWIVRYPFIRARSILEQNAFEKQHVIITVANHFEPGWSKGGFLDKKTQLVRLKEYREKYLEGAGSVRDANGKRFRHTNFYPAEQYDRDLLEIMAEMQADDLGDVELHLHHEGDGPDTAENTENTIVTFRDILAERHKCLSRMDGEGRPMYAFVHGNLALANSCGGRYCGVDNEMQVLQDTGCYADMTLPSAPDQSQVPMMNQIYECGGPLDQAMPHRTGTRLSVGRKDPVLPVIFTGPLVLNWTRRVNGVPLPRIDDGALAANQSLDMARLRRWRSANVSVAGRSEWIFIKLYCHGFFDYDQAACIGEDAKRFLSELMEYSARSTHTTVHFATAREAVNMVFASLEGKGGDPHRYRDHRLQSIMRTARPTATAALTS